MGRGKHLNLDSFLGFLFGKFMDEQIHLLLEIVHKILQLCDLGLKFGLP
jgi:hypothetical protein